MLSFTWQGTSSGDSSPRHDWGTRLSSGSVRLFLRRRSAAAQLCRAVRAETCLLEIDLFHIGRGMHHARVVPAVLRPVGLLLAGERPVQRHIDPGAPPSPPSRGGRQDRRPDKRRSLHSGPHVCLRTGAAERRGRRRVDVPAPKRVLRSSGEPVIALRPDCEGDRPRARAYAWPRATKVWKLTFFLTDYTILAYR